MRDARVVGGEINRADGDERCRENGRARRAHGQHCRSRQENPDPAAPGGAGRPQDDTHRGRARGSGRRVVHRVVDLGEAGEHYEAAGRGTLDRAQLAQVEHPAEGGDGERRGNGEAGKAGFDQHLQGLVVRGLGNVESRFQNLRVERRQQLEMVLRVERIAVV